MLTILNKLATFVGSACLAIMLGASGLATCAHLPYTTELLAEAFSGSGNPDTPFSHDDLVQTALAVRDFAVGAHDQEALVSALQAANEHAGTPYAQASSDELLQAPDIYTLTPNALSHLNDVYGVIIAIGLLLRYITMFAVIAFLFVGIRMGKRGLGGVLIAAGVTTIVVFVLIAAWAAADFNGFFAFFHSLFFESGTWTFSSTSLLITLYPPEFWVGMGVVWAATSATLSLACIAIGVTLRKQHVHSSISAFAHQ